MAKRRRTTRRRSSGIVSRVRSFSRGGGGKFGPAIQGLMAGLASQVGQKFLPQYGGTLGIGAVGYMTNNPTLLTLTGLQAANLIPVSSFLGGGSSSGASGTGGFI